MPAIARFLKDNLSDAKRIAVLAVGSELRGDDAAGILVADGLEKFTDPSSKKGKRELKVFIGSTAPENLTGEIIRYKPSHLIIVDTAEMGKKPGEFSVFLPKDIGGGATFSTHIMPAKVLVKYLLTALTECKIFFIGIQPKTLEFGKKPSASVKKTADTISRRIGALIG